MPDATGLELIAQRVRTSLGDEAVSGTAYARGQATLEVAPEAVHDVLAYLAQTDEEPWTLLMSLHGVDYLPEEPRLGVHYQLLSMERTDRLNVKTRLGAGDPHLPTERDKLVHCSLLRRAHVRRCDHADPPTALLDSRQSVAEVTYA